MRKHKQLTLGVIPIREITYTIRGSIIIKASAIASIKADTGKVGAQQPGEQIGGGSLQATGNRSWSALGGCGVSKDQINTIDGAAEQRVGGNESQLILEGNKEIQRTQYDPLKSVDPLHVPHTQSRKLSRRNREQQKSPSVASVRLVDQVLHTINAAINSY